MLAAAWTALFPGTPIALPWILREAAFALVGLDVGLRFTRAAIRQARRALPALLLSLAILLAFCFGLAVVLARTTDMSLLDAHLATTPGGLTVVAATAHGTGADAGLVGAIQTVRLILMLLFAPTAVRLTVGRLSG